MLSEPDRQRQIPLHYTNSIINMLSWLWYRSPITGKHLSYASIKGAVGRSYAASLSTALPNILSPITNPLNIPFHRYQPKYVAEGCSHQQIGQ